MTPTTSEPPRNLGRSIGAVLAGFVLVVVLSLVTDQVFHWLDVYPPWGQAMRDTDDNLLALAYRCIYAVFGSYIAARLAPRNPMRHAVVLGLIGLVVGTLGAVVTIPMDLGPAWYPILLAVTALPCGWLGGWLHGIRQAAQSRFPQS